MSQNKVKQTVIKAAADQIADLEGEWQTSWPNKLLEPPQAQWIGVHYLPAKPDTATLGDLGEEELDGVLQIDVNIPTNTGEKAQNDALDALESWFIPGKVFTHSSQAVTFLSCARVPGRIVDSSWRVSLSIVFSGRYNRPTLA